MSATISNEIERRYGPSAAEEWQLVRRHFELGEGFALIVLAVPDRVVARACRRDLETFLQSRSLRVAHSIVDDPEWLRRLTPHLLTLPEDPNVGAVWVEAVSSERASDHERWAAAWRQGLGSLNQQRNPLRRHLNVPLLIVGAPWVLTIIRETAPDLWSVRALTIRIEGERVETDLPVALGIPLGIGHVPAPDPILASRAVDRLRGRPGLERALADALVRMALGFAARRDLKAAEAGWREAMELERRLGMQPEAAYAALNLAQVLRAQGRTIESLGPIEEAVLLYRSLAGERPATLPDGLAAALNNLAMVLSDLGRVDEALSAAQEAVAILHRLSSQQPDVFQPNLAGTLNTLAGLYRRLGRSREAKDTADEALAVYQRLAARRPGAYRADLALVWNNLAALLSDLGQHEDALAAAERAVALRRELAAERPEIFLPDLATALTSLAGALDALGEKQRARAAIADALREMIPLLQAAPAGHADRMAGIVRDYIERCAALTEFPDPALVGPIAEVLGRISAGQS